MNHGVLVAGPLSNFFIRPAPMPTAKVNDINIYYEECGEGVPLLLIPGIAMRGESFALQLPDLARHFKTVIFDNRGVGKSDQPQGACSIAQMTDDVVALLDALEIDRAHVFGVSMGGMIAQELVLQHPYRVARVALGCTHCGSKNSIPTPNWVNEILYSNGKTREQLVRNSIFVNFAATTLRDNVALVEKTINQIINNGQTGYAYAQQLAAINAFDSYDRLQDIPRPTLVITGREDVMVPPANSALIARRIPTARLVEIAVAGHFFFLEKPNQTNQILIDFFQDQEQ